MAQAGYASLGQTQRRHLVRSIIAVTAVAFLLTPAAAPAHHSNAKEHQEMAQAAKKKSASKTKIRLKKEQYMRAVPSR
jgi:hypothetical protein